MADLCDYASRPLAFILQLCPAAAAVACGHPHRSLGAVACSVGTQYGVKFLVDTLSDHDAAGVWTAFLAARLADRRR